MAAMRWPGLLVLLALGSGIANEARATVTSSARSVTYDPSGLSAVFTVTFDFQSASQLRVYVITESTSAESLLTLGVGYSVAIPVGTVQGFVTLTSPIGAGYRLRIDRHTPHTQTTSFKTQGTFNPAAIEDALDKTVMMIQEVAAGASDVDADAAIEAHEAESDPHTVYARLLGRSGGQHLRGGTASGQNLQLSSTAHATKGKVLLGSGGIELVVDDVLNRVGIGTATPNRTLQVAGDADVAGDLYVGDAVLAGRIDADVGISYLSQLTTPLLEGATGEAGDLTIMSTTHATKGLIYLGEAQNSAFDETTDSLTLAGTLTAEQVTSTDDMTVADDVTVGGDITASGAVTGGNIFANGGGVFSSSLESVAGVLVLESYTDAYLRSSTGGEFVYIGYDAENGNGIAWDEANGRLGVGTETPAQELDVQGDGVFSDSVGVGTTSPEAELDVRGQAIFRGTTEEVSFPYSVASDGTDCNKTLYSDTDTAVWTLPSVGASLDGCEIEFVNTATAGQALITVDVQIGDNMYGTCSTAAADVTNTGTAGKGMLNTKATAKRGDRIRVRMINETGKGGWYIVGCTGVWAVES